MGDLPGIYQVSTVCGQSAFGKSPLPTQTATRLAPEGGSIATASSAGRIRFSASTMRKKRGAAASAPTNAGLPWPLKFPIQITSAYGPAIPADQASRKPHDEIGR